MNFSAKRLKSIRKLNSGLKHSWALAVIAASGIAAALLLSWPVNINLFSLHHFYRNRLTRCYLGATNSERKPNPLTGFDPHDDISMDKLVKQGPPHIVQMPLHIIGAAIQYEPRSTTCVAKTAARRHSHLRHSILVSSRHRAR